MSYTVKNSGRAPAPADAGRKIAELKVSATLMTLDTGVFCLFQQPGAAAPPADGSGLPGVRITLPPGAQGQDSRVTIRSLRDDGWLGPEGGAALVQVSAGPAQILVTVYQSPEHPADTAPRLQVARLGAETAPAPRMQTGPLAATPAAAAPVVRKPVSAPPTGAEMVAHIQLTGDVGARFGEWLGTPGSKNWIEGFAISGRPDLAAEDIEYQAVLGRDWLSPWVAGAKFCGSRGMALPLLGFNLRLRGAAAEKFDCRYSAHFTDGTSVGPLEAGQPCAADSLAPLEAFRVELSPGGTAPAAVPEHNATTRPRTGKPTAAARKRGR